MAIKKIEQTYAVRNAQPRGGLINAEFIKSSIRRINALFTGRLDTPQDIQSKQAAIDFLKKTIDKITGEERPENAFDRIIKYPGYFYFMSFKSSGYNKFKRDKNGKLVRKVPYYDSFPLLFVLAVDSESVMGVNFHFIKPNGRAYILKKLIMRYPAEYFEDRIMRPMNYNIFINLMGTLGKKLCRYAIRRYKWSDLRRIGGIRSIRIPNTEMMDAIAYTSPVFIGITDSMLKKKFTLSTSLPAKEDNELIQEDK